MLPLTWADLTGDDLKMLTGDYLRIRGTPETVGQTRGQAAESSDGTGQVSFAEELRQRIAAQSGVVEVETPAVTTAEQLEIMSGINFSRHAVDRINSRQIDVMSGGCLERLSRGLELAESKGSDDAVVIIDSTAFVVNVPSNKVITAVSAGEMSGNVFTNIDTAVII